MLKRPITYTDFNDQEVTEIFYFNISKPEMMELEIEKDGGLAAWLERIIETKDHKKMLEEFKRLVLLAYGEKSDDGKRFVKNEALREGFAQSAAYIALYMELATDDDAAAAFIKGIVPQDMAGQLEPSKPPVPPTR